MLPNGIAENNACQPSIGETNRYSHPQTNVVTPQFVHFSGNQPANAL